MSDPIHSSSWTGPLDERTSARGAFTYGPGETAVTSDYARILRAQRQAPVFPPGLVRVFRLGGLLVLSPLLLLAAWLLLHSLVRDAFVEDNRAWLVAWGCSVIALGLLSFKWRSTAALFIPKLALTLALAATAAFSGAYVYLGLVSYGHATPSPPERTFELYKRCGRRCVTTVHQRVDGSTVEGVRYGPPVPYAPVCARVQRLDGNRGFRWIRVLERSQPFGQVAWPIRREACFGTQPVSSLKG